MPSSTTTFADILTGQRLYAAREYGAQQFGTAYVPNVPPGFGLRIKVFWVEQYLACYAAGDKAYLARVVGPHFDNFQLATAQALESKPDEKGLLSIGNAYRFWDGCKSAAAALAGIAVADTGEAISAEASAAAWEEMAALPGKILREAGEAAGGAAGGAAGKALAAFLEQTWPYLLIGGLLWMKFGRKR